MEPVHCFLGSLGLGAIKEAYEKKIIERFGGQQELNLVMPVPPSEQSPPDASAA